MELIKEATKVVKNIKYDVPNKPVIWKIKKELILSKYNGLY